jgi:hypothetical protein
VPGSTPTHGHSAGQAGGQPPGHVIGHSSDHPPAAPGASGPTHPAPTGPGHATPGHATPGHSAPGHSNPAHTPRTGHPTSRAAASRPSLGGWWKDRREERAQRRTAAGLRRVTQQVEQLGPQWRIVDYHADDPDFLAIGPGGIFQVTVCDHGRSKVMLAGDVVQVDGRRPPYVALARRDAARISGQMSRIVGRRIPVIPVVAFLGTGEIVYYGLPPERCVVTTLQDLRRALGAHGNRLAQPTIEKLTRLAQRVDSATVGQYLGGRARV